MAYPPMPYEEVDAVQRFPRQGGDDQVFAADSSYGAAPVGRVKIQVYRGPSKGEGYDVFAPWGYYNTQPANLATYGLVWCNWSHFLSLLVVSRFRFIVDP